MPLAGGWVRIIVAMPAVRCQSNEPHCRCASVWQWWLQWNLNTPNEHLYSSSTKIHPVPYKKQYLMTKLTLKGNSSLLNHQMYHFIVTKYVLQHKLLTITSSTSVPQSKADNSFLKSNDVKFDQIFRKNYQQLLSYTNII
jgi:hypothetical protein